MNRVISLMIVAVLLSLVTSLVLPVAEANTNLPLIRRIAVFPIAGANVANAEDAWWQMRELLTKDQRFFVASRRFMVNRGVFQARTQLKPADAIILAKILDAQALVISHVKDRAFHVKVYEGENGYLLWERDIQFHPAISINEQIIRASGNMINDFMSSLPFQGFQIIDELIAKPVYEDGNKKLAYVFAGNTSNIRVGDPVQWISVVGDVSGAYLNNAPRITVIAEGIVQDVRSEKVLVDIQKARDVNELVDQSMVRFPREVLRLTELLQNEDRVARLGSEYLSEDLKPINEHNKDHGLTGTGLAWIFNLAIFILLAF